MMLAVQRLVVFIQHVPHFRSALSSPVFVCVRFYLFLILQGHFFNYERLEIVVSLCHFSVCVRCPQRLRDVAIYTQARSTLSSVNIALRGPFGSAPFSLSYIFGWAERRE